MQPANGARDVDRMHSGAINSQSNVLKIFFMWSKSFLKVLDRFGWSADPCAICFYRQMCKLPLVAQLLWRRHSWAGAGLTLHSWRFLCGFSLRCYIETKYTARHYLPLTGAERIRMRLNAFLLVRGCFNRSGCGLSGFRVLPLYIIHIPHTATRHRYGNI